MMAVQQVSSNSAAGFLRRSRVLKIRPIRHIVGTEHAANKQREDQAGIQGPPHPAAYRDRSDSGSPVVDRFAIQSHPHTRRLREERYPLGANPDPVRIYRLQLLQLEMPVMQQLYRP